MNEQITVATKIKNPVGIAWYLQILSYTYNLNLNQIKHFLKTENRKLEMEQRNFMVSISKKKKNDLAAKVQIQNLFMTASLSNSIYINFTTLASQVSLSHLTKQLMILAHFNFQKHYITQHINYKHVNSEKGSMY